VMKLLVQCLAVGGGGFVGALARWVVATSVLRVFDKSFPLGTLLINVSGSFFLGWFMTFVTVRYPVSDALRLAVATGFVGAYTTFSTYMYESNGLFQNGAQYQAWGNLIGSLILGLIAVKLGVMLGAHQG
jgi:fluoride exporter